MFSKIKLKSRIFLGYIIPLPLLVLIAALISINGTQVKETFKMVVLARNTLEVTDGIVIHISSIERALNRYLLLQESKYLEVFNQSSQDLKMELEVMNHLQVQGNEHQFNGTQKRILAEMISDSKKLLEFDEKLIDLVKNDQKEEALKLFAKTENNQLYSRIETLNKQFNESIKKQIESNNLSLNNSLIFLNSVATSGTIMAIIISLFFGFLLSSLISKMIHQSANIIVKTSSEIASTVEEQERLALQQAASVSQTTANIDQLGASSRESAEQAAAASLSANHVLSLAVGNEKAAKTVNSRSFNSQKVGSEDAQSLQQKMSQLQEQIFHLSEYLNQIHQITHLVNDLANQTNILALNASVEAVRAGEQGKGFGVVASEIRKLADQSHNSLERINTLMSDIKNTTHSTITVTEQGTKAVYEIAKAINNVAVNIQQISLNTKQQAMAIEQVIAAMNSLNIVAQETASGIGQTKIGTQQLNQTALQLKAML